MPYLVTVLRPTGDARPKCVLAADGVMIIPGGDTLTLEAYQAAYGTCERVELRIPAVTLAELAAVLHDNGNGPGW